MILANWKQHRREKYKSYYDYTGKTADNVQVPVTQIKCVSRISGYSWFKLLEYSILGVPTNIFLRSFNLNQKKILSCLTLLKNTNLQSVNRAYQGINDISMNCYEKKGRRGYYETGQGNHRTITAKVYGLHDLKARTVYYYMFIDAKYKEL